MSEIDRFLARAVVEYEVARFGESLKNKGDSQSCMFDVRRLMSSPEMLVYVGEEMASILNNECSCDAVVGIATSGIPWATVASIYSGLPLLYVRKRLEPNVSDLYIEGIVPESRRVGVIDDLLFAGDSKKEAVEILQKAGLIVTDILVVVNRQIQRVKDGPPIDQKLGVKLHSLITMDEVVSYMLETQTITEEQLERLVRDYRQFGRHDMPNFAK